MYKITTCPFCGNKKHYKIPMFVLKSELCIECAHKQKSLMESIEQGEEYSTQVNNFFPTQFLDALHKYPSQYDASYFTKEMTIFKIPDETYYKIPTKPGRIFFWERSFLVYESYTSFSIRRRFGEIFHKNIYFDAISFITTEEETNIQLKNHAFTFPLLFAIKESNLLKSKKFNDGMDDKYRYINRNWIENREKYILQLPKFFNPTKEEIIKFPVKEGLLFIYYGIKINVIHATNIQNKIIHLLYSDMFNSFFSFQLLKKETPIFSDSYIAARLNVPTKILRLYPELIETKRMQLLIKREYKQKQPFNY